MKTFCFTVDDNIRFFKEINQVRPQSLFDHPYLAVYRRLHQEFALKVQLNLFYRDEEFDLSQMTADYYEEWKQNADWLKLSFHSDRENKRPYEASDYEEVYADCGRVHREILRFASPAALAETTTVHYCLATEEGLRALADHQVKGLLGLFGTDETPRTSYQLDEEASARLRKGELLSRNGITYAPIDIVLNIFPTQAILEMLSALREREQIWVMIHEQYFYPDYRRYQPEFEEKLRATFTALKENRFQSLFFEELL